jgi:hypothetical protein
MNCESVSAQEPQGECAAVSHRVSSEIPQSSVYGRSEQGAEGDLPRDSGAVRGRVSGDRCGQRPRTFSSAVRTHVQSNPASEDDQESDSQRDIQTYPECKERVMGRSVVVKWLLHYNSREAWQRTGDSKLRQESGRGISKVASPTGQSV